MGMEFLWAGDPLSEVFWDVLVGKTVHWFVFSESFLVMDALFIRGGDAIVGVGLVSDFEELFLLAVDKIVLLHLLKFDFEVVRGNILILLET